jgi:eukaryotic-like serine/threonine-protein kinase
MTGTQSPSNLATLPSGNVTEGGADRATRDASAWLERGAPIGRYVILSPVGSGGMGIVYAAYDPELDRKVAVKLMHIDADRETLSGNRRDRLLREAKAMARLSHPNVVAVHDVGTIGDDIFVAMEFVDGQTLTDWMQIRRPWRDVLTLFEQAGRGLAAAHAKDLVHRDFKPDNVLVGSDERPRVTDFGLARAMTEPSEAKSMPVEPTVETELSHGSDLLASPLTLTGILLGTPAYMSPEQLAGERADARSDQFAFCVAAWEALYGQRPFAGGTPAALSLAVLEGRRRTPPRDRDVPQRIRRALERGLEARPTDRFPSMDALLDALGTDPARRWKRLGWGASAGLVLASAIVGGTFFGREHQVCHGASAKLAGVWDDERRQRVETAFDAIGRSYAKSTFTTVGAGLDAYASAWATAYTDACEDTHVRGAQSSELLDLRMGCLDRRRTELQELVEQLASADASTIRVAPRAVQGLGELGTCADREALLAPLRPPSDPARRRAVEEVETTLARLRAIRGVGKFPEALALAQTTYEDALRTEHRPVVADAGYELGVLQWINGDPKAGVATLEAAFHEAIAGHHDERASEAASEIVHIYAANLENFEASATWAMHVRGLLQRLGRDPDTDARLTNALGILHEKRGDYEEALRLYQASADARERTHGRADLGVANAINNIALVLEIQTKYAEALEKHREALAIRAEIGGAEHPDVADSHNNLGLVLQGMGRLEEAKQSFERSIAIHDAAMGPGSLSCASALNNLGALMNSLDEPERALELFGQALEIRERELGSDNAMVASILKNRGNTLIGLERFDEARPELERALAIQQKQLGADHPYGAETITYLGNIERYTGNHDAAIARYLEAIDLLERAFPDGHGMTAQTHLYLARARRDAGHAIAALADFERALPMAEATLGPSHSMTGNILHEIASMYLEGSRASEAVPLLERAASIREVESTPDVALGNTLFALARALHATGEAGRARVLAERARQAFSAAQRSDRLAELDAWLPRMARTR